MSHSSANFIFPDGDLLHGEYNGTSDIMCPMMFASAKERDDMWRKQTWDGPCECEGEPVIAHSHYGGGFEWDGRACRKHMLFLGPRDPFYEDIEIRDDEAAIAIHSRNAVQVQGKQILAGKLSIRSLPVTIPDPNTQTSDSA